MDKQITIAIDGPSGAGKSTMAKAVAQKLGIEYIDTGAMYRAVGYKTVQEGVDPQQDQALEAMLERTEIDFSQGDIILDGVVVNDQIRTPQMSLKASECSARPQVRKKLVQLQRQMARRKSVIMDGRDIGTNVLPDADYKFFLTASPEERARRRYEELTAKGEQTTLEAVLEEMAQRDHNDRTRELNPLRKAEDALELDTTGMSIEAVVTLILEEVQKNGNRKTF